MTNANTTFLLLNNEFRNQTFVSGFQFYAATAGSINIQVKQILLKKFIYSLVNISILKLVSSDICGTLIPCASYLSQFPFSIPFNSLNSWTFTMTAGLNTFYLAQPLTVNQGNLFQLVMSAGGKLAIDTSTNTTFSDMAWQGTIWAELSPVSNWRFYFSTINNYSSYVNTFSLQHQYTAIGLYTLSLTFLSSNLVYEQIVNITDCMLL